MTDASGSGLGCAPRRWAWLVVALACCTAVPAEAQRFSDVVDACTAAGGVSDVCTLGAVTARSLFGQTAVLSGFGAPVSGTSSTLGTRIGGSPRWSIGVRAGGMRTNTPDLSSPGGGETSLAPTAVQATVLAGLFEGFRLLPTVGGFLSTEVIGQAGWLFLPSGRGFEGSVPVYSGGVRLGVLREGFTLPGVSVSVIYRRPGEIRFGDTSGADVADVAIDGSITSVRATVGKDLFAWEVLAGWGWDRYSGDVALTAEGSATPLVTSASRLEGTRHLVYGSMAKTVNIILSISLEAGWMRGIAPVPIAATAYGAEGSGFLSGALRLTL